MEALRRFREGAKLPWSLLRLLRDEPEPWRAYWRLTLARMAVVVALTAPLVGLGDGPELEGELAAWQRAWQWIAWVAGLVVVAQWVVVAFSREFDEPISDALARLAKVTPEPAPASAPRVRLRAKWVWKRVRRRWQVVLAAAPGFLVFALVFAVLPNWPALRALSSACGAAWGFYWLMVGTAAKSAAAWANEGHAAPPVYVRWLQGSALTRWFSRLWGWTVRAMMPPAEAVERRPLEFAGLAAVRLAAVIPFVALWLRPLVPVASASLLEEGRARAAPNADEIAQGTK